MPKAQREKGKRRERAIAYDYFAGVLGWVAWRTAAQAHTRGDTPDVVVQSPIGVLFVEVKDDATIPGKTFWKAWDQACSYCKAGELPVLTMHRQGTSVDLVVMEKATLVELVRRDP